VYSEGVVWADTERLPFISKCYFSIASLVHYKSPKYFLVSVKRNHALVT